MLSETMTDMEKLERLFTEAAVAAGKAAQNPETADPTFRKGVYAEGVRDAGERARQRRWRREVRLMKKRNSLISP